MAATLLGTAVGILLLETTLWVLGLPAEGPFLQEFYGKDFKLMCFSMNINGDLNIDLRNPEERRRYSNLPAARELERSWRETPWAVEVRFDSQGFREKEIEAKRAGTIRIVFVGDSFTYGHGVPEDAPYPRQVERLLRQRFRQARFEVLNLGVGGLDLPGLADLSQRALSEMEPDILIYGYFINDPGGMEGLRPPEGINTALRAAWRHQESDSGYLALGARQGGFPRSYHVIKRFMEQRRTTRATLGWYREIHELQAWAPVRKAIAGIARSAGERGVYFAVLPLPLAIGTEHGEYPLDRVYRNITEGLRSEDIPVIELLPHLIGMKQEELVLHPEDLHPGSKYYRIAAQVIVDELARDPHAPLPGPR